MQATNPNDIFNTVGSGIGIYNTSINSPLTINGGSLTNNVMGINTGIYNSSSSLTISLNDLSNYDNVYFNPDSFSLISVLTNSGNIINTNPDISQNTFTLTPSDFTENSGAYVTNTGCTNSLFVISGNTIWDYPRPEPPPPLIVGDQVFLIGGNAHVSNNMSIDLSNHSGNVSACYVTDHARITNMQNLSVAETGIAYFIVNASASISVRDVMVGQNTDAYGLIAVSENASLLVTNSLIMGQSGNASLIVSGGNASFSTSGEVLMAKNAGSFAETILEDSAHWTAEANMQIGGAGDAFLVMDNSSITSNASIKIAETGNATLSLLNSSITASGIYVVYEGSANITADNSTLTTTGSDFFIGRRSALANITLSNGSGIRVAKDLVGSASLAHGGPPFSSLTLSEGSSVIVEGKAYIPTVDIVLSGASSIIAESKTPDGFAPSTEFRHIVLSDNSYLDIDGYLSMGNVTLDLTSRIFAQTMLPSVFGAINVDCSNLSEETYSHPTVIDLIVLENPLGNDFPLKLTGYDPADYAVDLAWDDTRTILQATIVKRSVLPTRASEDPDAILSNAFGPGPLLRSSAAPASGGTSYLPRTHIKDGNLAISFTPVNPAFLYEVQQSMDLQNWTTIRMISGGNGTEKTIEVNSAGKNLFLRVKVSELPEK